MRVWDWVISRWFGDRRSAVLFSRSWRAGVVLVLLCLTVYLPGLFTIPPIDRDESRFAQASRQMFEAAALPEVKKDPAMHSGGWVVPMLQDKPRLNKPPLVYWLQVASAWVFTGGDPLKDEIWMYRIPGVLCAILTVLMTWRMGLGMFDPRAAFLGAALLAVCPLIVFDAHQARADQLLLATVVATQWALWRVWRGGSIEATGNGQWAIGRSDAYGDAVACGRAAWTWAFVFWVSVGLSVLAKGPIGPMIAGLTVLALCLASRRWRWLLALRPVIGVVIVCAMVGPWLYAVGEHVGWVKYLAIIKDETIGRSLEPKEGHWGPPGYHTVLLAALFWPGSLTTAMAVGRAFGRGWPRNEKASGQQSRDRERAGSFDGATAGKPKTASLRARLRSWFDRRPGRDAELFCIAWIVPAWIVFELIGTKLPHYTMPMYPAVALVSARGLLSAGLGFGSMAQTTFDRVGRWIWCVIGTGVIAVPLVLAASFKGGEGGPTQVQMMLIAGMAIIASFFGYIAVVSVLHNRLFMGVLVSLGSVAAALIGFFAGVAPAAAGLSTRVDQTVSWIDPENHRPFAAFEYQEDSLVYLTRGRVRRPATAELEQWVATHPNGLVSTRGHEPVLSRSLWEPIAEITGINVAKGRRDTVMLWQRSAER